MKAIHLRALGVVGALGNSQTSKYIPLMEISQSTQPTVTSMVMYRPTAPFGCMDMREFPDKNGMGTL